jgi:NADH:ubiquinone oxidoreductase subunit 3 (subunit A)
MRQLISLDCWLIFLF